MAGCLLLLLSYFIISRYSAGNSLYVTNVGRGFYPQQFTEWYPFLPASFINIDFGAQLIQSLLGIDYSNVILILKILNAVFFFVLLIILFRFVFPIKKFAFPSGPSVFILSGSVISGTIVAMLAYLTLTYKELSWGYYKWTHVQDPRYFAFIYVFVPFLLITCWQHYPSVYKNIVVKIISLTLAICLLTEVVHGVYYNAKIVARHNDFNYIRNADAGFRKFPSILLDTKTKNPEKEVLVCSPDHFYLHTAAQMGYKAIFDYNNFLDKGLQVTSKSLLLMPINTRDVVIIQDFIKKNKMMLYTAVGETSFYIQEINPQ